MYTHINLKELRPQLPKVVESVDKELERYIISKRGHPVAILMAIDDYESMLETLNEVSDQNNLNRIKKGLAEAKKGKTVSWEQVKSKHHLS